MRHTKQKLVAFDEATKNALTAEEKLQWKSEFNQLSVKLKSHEAVLKDFCNQTGLKRDRYREQVFATKTENGLKNWGKSTSQKAIHGAKKELDKYKEYHYNKDGTIVVTDSWIYKKESLPKEYKPYAVIETMTSKGAYYQRNITYYNKDAIMVKQVHGGHHGNPKMHPYGNSGEHMHIYKWGDNGELIDKSTGDLTNNERKECKDIL